MQMYQIADLMQFAKIISIYFFICPYLTLCENFPTRIYRLFDKIAKMFFLAYLLQSLKFTTRVKYDENCPKFTNFRKKIEEQIFWKSFKNAIKMNHKTPQKIKTRKNLVKVILKKSQNFIKQHRVRSSMGVIWPSMRIFKPIGVSWPLWS